MIDESSLHTSFCQIGYNFNVEWLRACVSFIRQNSSNGPQIKEENLREEIIEQFVLSDIQETSSPLLNDLKAPITFINRDVVLQANWFLNISESYYSQHTKLSSVRYLSLTKSNEKKDTPSNQTYMFQLTDGQSELKAISQTPLCWIHPGLHPGFKIIIKKGVSIVNSILLLTSSNCEYIGGMSESLLSLYSTPSLLKNLLNIKDKNSTEIIPSQPVLPNVKTSDIDSKNFNFCNKDMDDKKDSFNDSLSDILSDIPFEDFEIIQPEVKAETKPTARKDQNKYQTLKFEKIPCCAERPFVYLNELPRSDSKPFLCRALVTKIYFPMKFSLQGSCELKTDIDDGSAQVYGFVSNTLFFSPPFMANSLLIKNYLNNLPEAVFEMESILLMLEQVLRQSHHCLLLRQLPGFEMNVEIIGVYSCFPPVYVDYLKYQEYSMNS